MRVRQSVPSYGALHLVVGMNFSVPETTDIWSAGKTALVPFVTELTVQYTTRVRGLTGTPGCVRERDFRANLRVALAHLPHWQGLSGWTDWGGGGAEVAALFCREVQLTRVLRRCRCRVPTRLNKRAFACT